MFYEKRCSYKLHKIYRKTPVPESFFKQNRKAEGCNFIKKETLAQGLSCEFCEMSTNTYFKTPLETASDFIRSVFFLYFPLSKIFAAKKVASCEKSLLVENRL